MVFRWLLNILKVGNLGKDGWLWNLSVMSFDVSNWKVRDKWGCIFKRKGFGLIFSRGYGVIVDCFLRLCVLFFIMGI